MKNLRLSGPCEPLNLAEQRLDFLGDLQVMLVAKPQVPPKRDISIGAGSFYARGVEVN